MVDGMLRCAAFLFWGVAVVLTAIVLGAVVRWALYHTNIGARDYSRMDPETLVPIARFDTTEQAQRAHNRLNGCGIRCLVIEEQYSQYNYRLPRGFGLSPHIEVQAGDAGRALEILGEKE